MRALKFITGHVIYNPAYIYKSQLKTNTDPNTLHSGKYNSNLEIRKGDNVPLNGDHTHFLLIDDGSRYRFFGKYAEFITRFERMVRDPAPAVSINIIVRFVELSESSHICVTAQASI